MDYDHKNTLDPKDWEQSKALMHKMVDDAFDYIKNIRSRKIWQSMPEEVLDGFTYKSPEKLKQLFDNVCGSNKELVYSCGSGLTACIIMLAGQLANKKGLRIYDGSWTEWAERNALYS